MGFELGVYIEALRRRLWLIALIFLTGTLVAGAVAAVLPPVFKATAVILVQSQQIPTELAKSTVTDGGQERLASLRTQLTSRENLIDAADRLNLFPELANGPAVERAEKVREHLDFRATLVNPHARYPSPVDSIEVTYTAESSWLAARVANDFVSQIIERNLSTRIQRASTTTDFFKEELARIEAALKESGAKIASFKKANEATLPDTLPIRREELMTLRERVFEIDRQSIDLTEEKRALILALEDAAAGAAIPSVDAPPKTSAERSLEAARLEYQSQSAIYAASHPRMKLLSRRLQALEREVASEAEASAGEAGGDGNAPISPALRAQTVKTKTRIAEIDREIELLEKRRAEIATREDDLSGSIRATPEVELTLNAMLREQLDLKAQYEEIVAKLAEAAIGEQLELSRQGERFEVIEQAEPPTRPESPKRLLILAAGSAASLFAGIALVLALEFLNKTIRTVGDFEAKLDSHPFAIVPFITTGADIRRRWVTRIAGVAAFVGVSAGAAYSVDKFYMPLDQVVGKMVERSGVGNVVDMVKKRIDR